MSTATDKLNQTLRDAAARIGNPDLSAALELTSLRVEVVNLRAENEKLKGERRRWFRLLALAIQERGEVRLSRATQATDVKHTIQATDDPATGDLVLRLKS